MSHTPRRRSRGTALQILYQMDVASIDIDMAIRLYWSQFESYGHEGAFADQLARGVAGALTEIDAAITHASEHWRLDRMPVVDRNLLRLGCYELMASPQTPYRVTLNEAIELAKLYGNEESPSFVNGVLDCIARNLNIHTEK
ncbi:MAG: transcription antitermination factor NusB [Myxococcales bacterium]|nr:transcription antitermination factor NusB [Myxococcales bacterium]MCB9708576.1 transcription antitermination factor NusB [Myxococcales bacterium]